jgi:endonuclease/exonuclease/phosphatase family metal-dependent hydrolase
VTSLRVMTYNIKYGGAGREPFLIATIQACAPDVVLFQEATHAAIVEQLAAATGMSQWATFRRQSLAFMSRQRIDHYEWHKPRFSRHAFLEVVLPGVRLFGVHLSAVHAAWTERRRVFEARALLRGIARHQHGFHVLAGDFNTLPPGELLDIRRLPPRLRPFVWLSGGRIRWRTIHEVLDAGYVDALRLKHPDERRFSFPTTDPHLTLDYMFVPAQFTDRVVACDVVNHESAAKASDHFPLFAELRL